mgnify:CR=1 FL=1
MYLVLWWWENYDFVSVIVNIVWTCFNLYLPQVLWQQSRWRNSNVGIVLSKLILVIIVSYYGIKRETRKNGYQPLMTFILASLSYFRWMIVIYDILNDILILLYHPEVQSWSVCWYSLRGKATKHSDGHLQITGTHFTVLTLTSVLTFFGKTLNCSAVLVWDVPSTWVGTDHHVLTVDWTVNLPPHCFFGLAALASFRFRPETSGRKVLFIVIYKISTEVLVLH